MLGFDNYIPGKWLDGVLAIHVAAPKIVASRLFRGGKWAAKATVTAAFLAGGVVAAAAVEAVPGQTIEVLQTPPDASPAKGGDVAPPGYFQRLASAINQSTLLPEQSIVSDPEFSF